MSRMTHIPTAWSLLVAGIFTAATLAAPAVAHAQTGDGERALLNHLAAPSGVTAARALRIAAEHSVPQDPPDGQRALVALLRRVPIAFGDFDLAVAPALAQVQITGARALLGAVRIAP